VTTPLEPPDARVALISEVVFPADLSHHGTYLTGAARSFTGWAALGAAIHIARADAVMAAACERVQFGELVEASATEPEAARP
jgi:hypothetical protein